MPNANSYCSNVPASTLIRCSEAIQYCANVLNYTTKLQFLKARVSNENSAEGKRIILKFMQQ
jgi:hypothetical protein